MDNNVNLNEVDGAKLEYECFNYPQLKKINFLLPDYIIIAEGEQLPGILMRFLPKVPDFNEEIKTVVFENVYLKNVKIELNSELEEEIISSINKYREEKYNIAPNQYNEIIIKERRLKCGIHNTWCFINSNALENSISLVKNQNFLEFKGLFAIDRFFTDQQASCAFIIELHYTLIIPIKNEEETLNIIIGYSVYVPEMIDMDNSFRESYFITGPGMTIYGDQLWEPENLSNKKIKIVFILSKDEKPFEGIYEEKKREPKLIQTNQITQQNQINIESFFFIFNWNN